VSIIATGKDPLNQSNGGNISSGDTINTSQAGGPTTFGTNSQMITEQEGIRYTFVTGARQNVTIPNLDQNEADVEANIDFTAFFGTRTALFDVVQLQSGKTAQVRITASNSTYANGAGDNSANESGAGFIDGYEDDTPVVINRVSVTNTVTGAVIASAIGTTAVNGIAFTFTGGVVVITGVKADYTIEYTTTTDHNRVLVENGAALSASGNTHADFDIGGFKVVQTSVDKIEIGSNMVFEDDGPSMSTTGTEPTATVDETVLLADAKASFAANFTSAFGADGAGTTTYALGVVAGASGLTDTATNEVVNLLLNGAVVEGRTATTNALVFTVSVDVNGEVTLDQLRAVVHPTSDPDEPKSLTADNLVTLTATKTDKDGDSAQATLNIGQNLIFKDDGPSISTNAAVEPTATVDETMLLTDAKASFAANFTSAFGADGAGTTTYALGVVAGASGLTDTATNEVVNLLLNGAVVEGRTATTNALVFTVSVDVNGEVTLDQLRAVVHPTSDPDEPKSLTADNLVTLTATKTDKDGDSAQATLNIGQNLIFKDDGPAVSANAGVLLDDDTFTGGNPGGDGDDANSANVSGTLGHAFGEDGAGTVTYLTTGTPPTGFNYVLDGSSLLVKHGTTTVLTLTMVAATGAYTVVQNNPIPHAAGLTENNQPFTINYRVTDRDGDTADGTLGINVDDDTPVVTAKSNLVYANASNPPPSTDVGGTGIFAYAIGADKHLAPYSATNSDFQSVALTGGTVGGAAITARSVVWVSETDSQAVFDVNFTYVSNNPVQGAGTVIGDDLPVGEVATLTFNKTAGTYTLSIPEIESFSILNTSTPGNPLQGYALNLATTVGSNPPVSVMTLASNFFVQFEGFGVNNGTDQTFAYDSTTGLFSNDRRYVTVSSASIGAASDTLQSDEVIDLDFYTENPKGFATSVDPGNLVNPRAKSDAIFIEFTQAGPGAGKDMLVVLKLVNNNDGTTINRTFIVGNSAGNDDVINTSVPTYGFVAQAQNGIVVFERNDYNFTGENYSIQGAQVVTSTQGVSGRGYELNGALNNPATSAPTATTAFGGATTEGNNEPIKIVNIGFVSTTTPDTRLSFDVVLADADGDATGTQTLDVTIVGGNGVTASTASDTFVIGDTDVDELLSMVTTVIDGGFVTNIDKLNFTTAGSGLNYIEVLAPAANLAAFTAAADTGLNGTVQYYFGVVGSDGYLATDTDGNGITSIVKLAGVTDMAFTDIM